MGPAIAMKMACCGSVKVIECPPPPDLYVVVFFCSYLPALLEFGAPAAAVRDSRNTSAGLPVTAPAPVFEAKKPPALQRGCERAWQLRSPAFPCIGPIGLAVCVF